MQKLSEDVPLSYAKAVGERLRTLRHQQGLSLLAVEATSGREFKASVLGAYERGERIISVLRLQRLAEIYGVTVDKLLPRRVALTPSEEPDSLGMVDEEPERRPVRIDLSRLKEIAAPERDVIRRYVGMIQAQRNQFEARLVAIRDEDLRALARFFELDEKDMKDRLAELGLHQ